jgi:hypothetical protein
MTSQEAINLIHCCMHIGNERIIEARNMAISTLEKQIPKKPNIEGDGYDDKGELIYDTAVCPNCDYSFDLDYDCKTKCCPDCGQALDWDK